MNILLNHLAQSVWDREADQGYLRLFVDNPRSVLDKESFFYLGGDKVTDLGRSKKYVRKDLYPCTPGELAREYLRQCIERVRYSHPKRSMIGQGKVKHSAKDYRYFDTKPPLYYLGKGEDPRGPWAYVDIRACYFSLYRYAWPDMQYVQGERLGRGHIDFVATDLWGEYKKARNAVIGTIRSRHVTVINRGVWRQIRSRPNYLSPCLYGYILDTMHAIAGEAVDDFGCACWLTDAGIMRPDRAEAFVEHLRRDWHLDARIEATGPGYLFSQNAYRIGNKISQQLRNGRYPEERGQPVNRIRTVPYPEIAKLKGWREWILEGATGESPQLRNPRR